MSRPGGTGWQRLGKLGQAEVGGHRTGQVLVDVAQPGDHPGADRDLVALAELEGERVDDVPLLHLRLAMKNCLAWL